MASQNRTARAAQKRRNPQSLIGTVLDDRYELLEVIGRGAMGVVFKAMQVRVQREVAVKLLHPRMRRDRRWLRRFQREAQLASRLEHPNTVGIIDFGDSEHGLYLVMQLLVGETLLDQIRDRGPMPPRSAIWVGRYVAAALAAAHSAGVVHRDLKPSNVFVHYAPEGPVVKVVDFGIAARIQANDRTRPARGGVYQTTLDYAGHELLGSVSFVSPEQILTGNADGQADLYSLGAVLYTVLTGHPPFTGQSAFEIMDQHVQAEPPRLPLSVPGDLAFLVHSLLAKNPLDRPPGARAVRSLLDRMLMQATGRRGPVR